MDKSTKPDYGPQNRGAKGQWGKWKGLSCTADGCSRPVSCRGLCASHYGKQKWADGHRPPSVNPDSHREAHLKHRYGITTAEYNALLATQHGVCAVCGKPPGADTTLPHHWKSKLAVDHCHDTGKVRGLLCNGCNAGVGHLGTESVALAAARYLRLHDGGNSQH